MMQSITKEDSYAERRELFKNIWHAAMQIDAKEGINQPKVIKTLRLEEVDKLVIGKSKKERIRNIRTVCNKILEFCDRHDANDVMFEQKLPTAKTVSKRMNSKLYEERQRLRIAKSLIASTNVNTSRLLAKLTTKEIENEAPISTETTSPLKLNKASNKSSLLSNCYPTCKVKTNTTRRKIVRKKRVKRKKSADLESMTTSRRETCNTFNSGVRGRAVLRCVKDLLTANRITLCYPKAPSADP